jgi:uncharacterized cysteine cluster protein YcgN (CxxCxxCC family)
MQTIEEEPLWLAEDLEAVLIQQREQASLCSGCGLPIDETMDPENEGTYIARAFACHACAAKDKQEKKFTSGNHDADGLRFIVERRERTPRGRP